MKLALVGDIGGTNARFALWKDQQLDSIQVHATADYSSPEQAIGAYLKDLGLAPGSIGSVCLSVAGPVGGDEFRFTNNHWRLSRQAFCQSGEKAACTLEFDQGLSMYSRTCRCGWKPLAP